MKITTLSSNDINILIRLVDNEINENEYTGEHRYNLDNLLKELNDASKQEGVQE